MFIFPTKILKTDPISNLMEASFISVKSWTASVVRKEGLSENVYPLMFCYL